MILTSAENFKQNEENQPMNQNERDAAVIVATVCLVAGVLMIVVEVISWMFT